MRDLFRLLRLFHLDVRRTMLGVGLASGVALANVALLALSGWFITAMALAGLGMATVNYFAPAAAIRGLAIIRTVGRYGERLITHDETLRALARLRVWCYRRLVPLAPAALQAYRGGDLLSLLRADIDTLDNLYLLVIIPCVAAVIGVAAITIFLTMFSVQIALITLGGLVIAGMALPMLSGWIGKCSGARLVEQRSSLRSETADTLRGLGELWVFGASDRQKKRLGAQREELRWTQRRRAGIESLHIVLMRFAAYLTLWLTVLIAVDKCASGNLPPADLALVTFCVMAGFEVVQSLPAAFHHMGETRAAAARLFEIADMPAPIDEPNVPAHNPSQTTLRFENVWMRYEPSAPWALEGFDTIIKAGTHVGIVGATGAGKTSIFNALLRFWSVQQGHITVGGIRIDQLSSATVHKLITVVSQHDHLFNASIRDNLRLACPDVDDETLWQALFWAKLDAEVHALPDGLDTWIGETGARLSGGQIRRIAIARAMLKQAPLILLDEPTEGLDAISAQSVMASIDHLMCGRTALIITHRPQVLTTLKRVLVLEHGRVKADGSPDALAVPGGPLSGYWRIG